MNHDLGVTIYDLRGFRHDRVGKTKRIRQPDNLDHDSLLNLSSNVVKLSQKGYAFCVFRLSGIIRVKKRKPIFGYSSKKRQLDNLSDNTDNNSQFCIPKSPIP